MPGASKSEITSSINSSTPFPHGLRRRGFRPLHITLSQKGSYDINDVVKALGETRSIQERVLDRVVDKLLEEID